MPRVSLAYALKAKNRLVKRIAELEKRIRAHNMVNANSQRPFDLDALLEELQAEVEKLVQVKSAISAANAPIQENIYRLAELRGLAAYYQSIETENPYAYAMYASGNVVEMDIHFGPERLAKLTEETEARIDEVQDEIDRFNAKTEIEIPD